MSTTRRVPEALHKPNESHAEWLLRRIWDRVNRDNMHFMFVIVGQEGMGKSYTAIKMASTVDPTFDDSRVLFDVASLLQVLKDGEHQPGQFYVLDEAGVQLGRRTWQERGQVLANQALQLVRNHNLGLIFTLPRLSELDSQTQGRLQGFMELVDKVDGEHVTGKIKFFDPDRADDTGKIYKKYPRRRAGMGGQLARIERFSFTPPDEALTAPYEERKREFQDEFYQETIDRLQGTDKNGKEETQTPQEILKEIQDDGGLQQYIGEHSQNGQEYVKKDLLRATHGLSHADSRSVGALIEQEVGL